MSKITAKDFCDRTGVHLYQTEMGTIPLNIVDHWIRTMTKKAENLTSKPFVDSPGMCITGRIDRLIEFNENQAIAQILLEIVNDIKQDIKQFETIREDKN